MCMRDLLKIERRFKEISRISDSCDISIFPLPKDTQLQMKTDKQKSDMFGEVFTPLWFVDKMILKLSNDPIAAGKKLFEAKTPLDLCAGCGQFTLRMIRCIANYRRSQKKAFDVNSWLKKHSFSELQYGSVYKILYIFGAGTNIYIGDSHYLNMIAEDGILVHDGKEWINITKEVHKKFGKISYYDLTEEISFCSWLTDLIKRKGGIQTRLF